MNSLTNLKNKIQDKFKKSPIAFDGIILDYGKVQFSLISVDDIWCVHKGCDTLYLSTKDIQNQLPEIMGVTE